MSAAPRIASLLASATEMVCGVGMAERLVAISHECDFPPEILDRPRITRTRISQQLSSQAIDERVKAAAAAGEPLYEIDVPRLAALQPDVILTQAQCDVCAVRLADVERAVRDEPSLAGAQIVALQPNSLSDVLADVRRVGAAIGAEAQAAAYCAALERRMQAVARQAEANIARHGRRRVVLIEWIEPLMLAGNWMPELVELAGGEHRLTVAGAHSPYAAWETIRHYDPEVVLVAPCGFDLERTLEEAPLLAALPGWNDLSAVRASRVYAVDGNAYFNRSGPRLIDSLELLAALVYPEEATAELPAAAKRPWRKM